MKTRMFFFAFVAMVTLAKLISVLEIGFLIAITIMAIGAKNGASGWLALTGTVSLFFYLLSVPIPPQVVMSAYYILSLLGIVMAFAIAVVLAEKKTKVKIEFGHTVSKGRKAVTA